MRVTVSMTATGGPTLKTSFAIVLLAVGASGCANFKAVSEFAQQTTRVTGVVRAEFVEIDTICRDQAELTIVVNDLPDEGPLQSCRSYKATQGSLATVTLDVLDDYAKVLAGLADDKTFDLSSDIDTVGSKAKALKDRSGNALVSSAEATALTRIVEILAGIATERRRKAAVQRLVDEKPNLAITGKILRSFFVRDPNAPPGRAQAPYTNLVGLTSDALVSSERMLGSKAFRTAEPLRSVELSRALRARKAQLEARTGTAPDKVPVAIASAIDAWLAALETFSADAFEPDAKELVQQLKNVRSKANAAKEALQAANN